MVEKPSRSIVGGARWVAIGADGGGTHVRLAARLVGAARTVRAETVGINAAADPEGAARTLLDGVARLQRELGAQGEPTALFAGLAGAMDRALCDGVRARMPLARVVVEDDRGIAVAGALAGADGAVAGIGTGSFVGRVHGGAARLVGGWGFRVADQASGAWLGRALLTRAVLHADGVAEGGATVQATAGEFGSPLAISKFAVGASPADYARFAPRVMDAADRGEADLLAIVRDGADYVVRALAALGWRDDEPLCLVGGVGPRLAPFLPAPHRAAVRKPVGSPLEGALRRAEALARAAGSEADTLGRVG